VSLRRGRARAELNAEINVVSLIDVMMLLLVIFMITAPMMQAGMNVTLPTAAAAPLEARTGMRVTVAPVGIYIDDERLTDAEFRAGFAALAGARTKDGVYLLADSSVSLQRYFDVLSVLRSAGVENIMAVATPAAGTPRR
jgi:biopolymer transport protein TolR